MKHYEYEINQFVDGELPQQEHKGLFDHLATCNECQKTLSDYLHLKEKSRDFCSKNISKIKNKPSRQNIFYKIGFYTSAAAAVILLFVLFTHKPAPTYITKNEVRIDTVLVENNTPAENVTKKSASAKPKSLAATYAYSEQAFINYIMDLPTVKLKNVNKDI